MNVTEAIEMANKVEQPEPTQVGLDGNRQIKALIISLTADGAATHATRKLTQSIKNTGSNINALILNATTPDTISEGLNDIPSIKSRPKWTWPEHRGDDGLELRTGVYRKTYECNDVRKGVACMVSHMRAWQ